MRHANLDNMTEPDRYLARDLSVSAMRLGRRLRLRHSDDRIPLAQMSIVGTLLRDGAMTTGELAARERIKPPSISRSSHALFEMGLIERLPHPTDRRQVLLTLTDAGRQIAREDMASRERALAEQLSELSPVQRAVLGEAAGILTAIVENVE